MTEALSENTQLTITIGAAATVISLLVVATWRVANRLRDILEELKKLSGKIDGVSADSWKISSMERWVSALRWENRKNDLIVPDPRESISTSSPFPPKA